MSSTPLSHQSPLPTPSNEAAAGPRRIKLTIKPPKSRPIESPSVDRPDDDGTIIVESAPSSSHARFPITLKIKPSRPPSTVGAAGTSSQDGEKKHLPRLILKPPKPSPAPAEHEDTVMEVDDPVTEVAQELPLEEPPKEEVPVEILAPPSPPPLAGPSQPPPPVKIKAPRPIKLKPLKEVLRMLITRIKK